MSFAARTWISGELVTAALGNANWRDALLALYAGEMAIHEQAALDFIYGASPTQLGRVAKGAGLSFPQMNAAGTAWVMVRPVVEQTVTSAATVTPSPDTADLVTITAQAVDLLFANPTPVTAVYQGKKLLIRLKATGVHGITYDTQYRAIGVALPTETVVGNIYMGFVWNGTESTWDNPNAIAIET